MVIEKKNLRSIADFSIICSYFDEGNQLVIDVMKAGVRYIYSTLTVENTLLLFM